MNRQSFVDEQEWHLYVHTECNKKELVIDQVDNSVKRSALSVKCRAARRPGYFVWNIFMITVGNSVQLNVRVGVRFSLSDNVSRSYEAAYVLINLFVMILST